MSYTLKRYIYQAASKVVFLPIFSPTQNLIERLTINLETASRSIKNDKVG